MDRKGFPESYDMEMLIDFLNRVKSGQEEIKVPVYSHDVYDIIPDKYELIQQPDILIVEGINTLQLPANQQIYVSDFFDFSVYVDADPVLIENGIWIVLVRYWIRLSKIQRIIIIVLLSEIVKKPLKWQKMYGKM